VRFAATPIAQEELAEAMRWYEGRRPGLGWEFLDEYASRIEMISKRPRAFALEAGVPAGYEVRSLMFDRFPYRLIYRVDAASVVLIALAHSARRPGYWLGRLGEEE
jgi:toxin ParE1/3/4